MYRIVCESYERFRQDYAGHEEDARYKSLEPLALILDIETYKKEKQFESLMYKKLSEFLFRIELDLEQNRIFSTLIWTLESREIVPKHYDVLSEEEFDEMKKTVQMFLRLAYWN